MGPGDGDTGPGDGDTGPGLPDVCTAGSLWLPISLSVSLSSGWIPSFLMAGQSEIFLGFLCFFFLAVNSVTPLASLLALVPMVLPTFSPVASSAAEEKQPWLNSSFYC